MQILASATAIDSELNRLISACSSCQIAVAWASAGFESFGRLFANTAKIKRMIVGTHFYQTHPHFIETFRQNANVRFLLNPNGVFHPKVYFFETSDRSWECIIGSPNFTQGGTELNDELAVLITADDYGASEARSNVQSAIDGYWTRGRAVSSAELNAYRIMWARKRPILKKLAGRFGNPNGDDIGDKGKHPLDVPILAMPWSEFFEKVKLERQTAYGHCMEGRLMVMRNIRQLFSTHQQFDQIDEIGRQRIAGLKRPVAGDDVDYRWFGSMVGSGKFWHAINSNDTNLSEALGEIPSSGEISREQYLAYVERFKRGFPEGRHGIGTATRLLAMKRPDVFVCFNDGNKVGLCGAVRISPRVGYEEYWDSVVARIMEANWWCAAPPQASVEREVWDARAAFLDSLYYDGADLVE
jgi:HKD family nuclease